MQAGIWIGKRGETGAAIAAAAARAFEERGVPCRVGGEGCGAETDAFYEGLDVLLAIGGDGTILQMAQGAAVRAIPVLGVNIGRLGFLAEVEPEGVERAVDAFIAGEFRLERRLMVEARVRDLRLYALNEIVLESTRRGRTQFFDISINDGDPDRVPCDGVMVASPTGSTAYSLSCGGPILSPELDAMVVTTICAHMLRARPIVVTPGARIALSSADDVETAVYADGIVSARLGPDEYVSVGRAPFDLLMVRFTRGDFYSLVRRKLSEWSRP